MRSRARRTSSVAFRVLGVVCLVAPSALGQTGAQPRPKDQFVTSLAEFVEAITGTYGDEGARVLSSLDGMRQALSRWDGSVSAYEKLVAAEIQGASPSRAAGMRLDLGLLYLDRGRVEDAVRELTAAVVADPSRADLWFLLGTVQGQRKRPAEAAAALRRSARLDPGKPITSYLLVSRLREVGELEEAERTREAFVRARNDALALPPATKPVAAPFVQWDLVQEPPDTMPWFAPARYREGFALLKQGRYDEAVSRLEGAAVTDPLTAPADTASKRMAQATMALRQGQVRAALDHLRAFVDIAPNNSEARRILGVVYWADGQRAKGIEQLEAGTRKDPANERARMTLADLLVAQRRFADAERVLQDAIQAIPGSGQAHFKLSQVSAALEHPSRALRELREAVTLTPVVGLAALYRAIGEGLSVERDFEAVVALYAEQVDLDPNNADAHIELGKAYLEQDRGSEAQAELLAALMIDAQRTDTYAVLAQANIRVGNHADAELAARRALEFDPMRVEAQYALATSLIRLGRIDEGKKELERYQQMRAEAEANRRREFQVTALLRDVTQSIGRGAYEEAASQLNRAILLKPADPALRVSLGLVLGNAGRLPEAIAAFEQALTLKADPEVHQHLSDVYTALGQSDEARRHRELYERLRKEGAGR